jgi:hypothetical protein
VQRTLVPPAWIKTLPGAVRVKARVILSGRSSLRERWSCLVIAKVQSPMSQVTRKKLA